jgi:hypothetical protein
MAHGLKTWDEFMMDIATGKELFEVRKNDRDYKVGDTLLLNGWNQNKETHTGRVIEAKVTYVLNGGAWGIMDGYVVMGIEVRNYNF